MLVTCGQPVVTECGASIITPLHAGHADTTSAGNVSSCLDTTSNPLLSPCYLSPSLDPSLFHDSSNHSTHSTNLESMSSLPTSLKSPSADPLRIYNNNLRSSHDASSNGGDAYLSSSSMGLRRMASMPLTSRRKGLDGKEMAKDGAGSLGTLSSGLYSSCRHSLGTSSVTSRASNRSSCDSDDLMMMACSTPQATSMRRMRRSHATYPNAHRMFTTRWGRDLVKMGRGGVKAGGQAGWVVGGSVLRGHRQGG